MLKLLDVLDVLECFRNIRFVRDSEGQKWSLDCTGRVVLSSAE